MAKTMLDRRVAASLSVALALFAIPGVEGQVRPAPPSSTPEYTFRIVNVYPHDPSAFTQGLEYRAGFLYEGTGLEGHSTLRKVELLTGKVIQSIGLAPEYFGEGITLVDQKIVQLTYQTQRGFVYDQATFRLLRTFAYPGEGWGLTNDGKEIFMSDGTAQLRSWDLTTLDEKRRFTVHEGKRPIAMLNELEYVHGEIYANIWQTDKIARISPADGKIVGWIDLAGLYAATTEERARGAVLNGIAYDSLSGRLFVTGKFWPKLFEIQVVRKGRAARLKAGAP